MGNVVAEPLYDGYRWFLHPGETVRVWDTGSTRLHSKATICSRPVALYPTEWLRALTGVSVGSHFMCGTQGVHGYILGRQVVQVRGVVPEYRQSGCLHRRFSGRTLYVWDTEVVFLTPLTVVKLGMKKKSIQLSVDLADVLFICIPASKSCIKCRIHHLQHHV